MSDFIPRQIQVKSKLGDYTIEFTSASNLKSLHNSVAIADRIWQVKNKVKELGFDQIIEVEAMEEKKNLDTSYFILEKLAELHTKRDTTVIAFGGGTVQDLATLATSLYMRGLNWIYVPTTLMSSMDSCVGGKSSINLGRFKNLIGNFHPPKRIIVDVGFFSSLGKVDISSGIAEGMKICYALSMKSFSEFRTSVHSWRESGETTSLENAIFQSLESKKWFIEVDEFDQSERKLLNFGHSFGHALEAASNYTIPHGIGVLIGMRSAILESRHEGACGELLSFIHDEIQSSGICGGKLGISKSIFKSALHNDKKNSTRLQVLVLPNRYGRLEIVERPLDAYALESCLNSLQRALFDSKVNYEVF